MKQMVEYRISLILEEFGKGCSNTVGENPAMCDECLDAAVEAILLVAKQENVMEWQPIETAPRDGTIIDVWLGDCDEDDRIFYCCGKTKRSTAWSWKNGKFRPIGGLVDLVPVFVQPTHWMPLPEAPR